LTFFDIHEETRESLVEGVVAASFAMLRMLKTLPLFLLFLRSFPTFTSSAEMNEALLASSMRLRRQLLLRLFPLSFVQLLLHLLRIECLRYTSEYHSSTATPAAALPGFPAAPDPELPLVPAPDDPDDAAQKLEELRVAQEKARRQRVQLKELRDYHKAAERVAFYRTLSSIAEFIGTWLSLVPDQLPAIAQYVDSLEVCPLSHSLPLMSLFSLSLSLSLRCPSALELPAAPPLRHRAAALRRCRALCPRRSPLHAVQTPTAHSPGGTCETTPRAVRRAVSLAPTA
jgi:hypothetical protein